MSNILTKSKKKRLSLFVNSELSERVIQISKQSKLTASKIIRNALQEYVCKLEKAKKIESELETGYKANHDYYLKSQKEWEYADIE